jgi:uncharacterized membrane protein
LAEERANPVILDVTKHSVRSKIAIAGHPIHAMSVVFPIAFGFSVFAADVFYWWSADPFWARVAVWAAGGAFWLGLFAGAAGTAELLLVPGVRKRAASWSHAITGMTMLAIVGLNWSIRVFGDGWATLPLCLFLSGLGVVFVGFAGWHGGKLVFDHGIGVTASSRR